MSDRSGTTVVSTKSHPKPSVTPVRTNLLQRQCACGGTPGPNGECAECREKRLQRRSTGRAEPSTVPPIVHDVLRSPGQPLDTNTRAFMEPRFGHDFSRVHVHADVKAAESAQAVNALAYTLGEEIVFGEGQYSPSTMRGRLLLAHELTHMVQQQAGSPELIASPGAGNSAEREAEAIASGIAGSQMTHAPLHTGHHPRALYRQQAPAGAPTSGMTRAEFEETMKKRFGVSRIVTGTIQQQASLLTPRGGAPPGGITLPDWHSWEPGASSPVYASIIESFEDFANSIGGVPVVQEVIFFNVQYEVNQAGVGIPQPDVGATFGAGHLTIYRALTTRNKALPISRSNVQGNYPSAVAQVVGVPGQTPGAPLPVPSREQSIGRLIGHELGHGLAEAAMGPNPASALDPSMMADYRREVGWTAGHPAQLFDVGVPAVAAALAAGTPPPAACEIIPNNWNSPQWVEQPLSHYMVKGGPAEDFAEAAMVFVHEPNLLLSRSSHRFRFLDNRKNRWLPRLLQLPRIGDFPEPRGSIRVA
jgi:hypothetical protein